MSFYAFQLNRDVDRYKNLYSRLINPTVYHSPEYLLAEEKGEEAPAQIFVCEKDGEIALMPLIKRDIGNIAGLEDFKGYFDLKTPHEYSGAVVSCEDESLYAEFWRELQQYALINSVVFLFVRFNPYRNDYLSAEKCGVTVEKSNEQVYIDLSEGLEAAKKEFSSSLRRNIRQSFKHNLNFIVAKATNENIAAFMNLYGAAMDRLEARPFFYFNEDYFRLLINSSISRLVFVESEGEKIAGGILLEEGERLYHHLGCRNSDYANMKPMEFMYCNFCDFAAKNGYKEIHLGGGSKSLGEFKARFSSHRVPYYIGYKIYDAKMYDVISKRYLTMNGISNTDYKPAYRAERKEKI